MKVILNKTICADFFEGAGKEWLEINSTGCYACSTIYGMNTRRYHGLFITPGKSSGEKYVMLSKFEESIFIDNQVYEISTNCYTGGINPDGYKYLQSFSIDPFPRFIYQIGERRIEKNIFLLSDKNVLIVRYTNKNQGIPVKIIIKPILAARTINELARESQNVNVDSYFDGKVVKINPTEDTPELKIYYSAGEYTEAPLWYYNFRYPGQDLRSKDTGDVEDLFNTGFFTCSLDTYESLDLFISVEEVKDFNYDKLYRREKAARRSIRSGLTENSVFVKDLSKGIERMTGTDITDLSNQLISCQRDQLTVREILFAAPGLLISERDHDKNIRIIESLLDITHRGLLPEYFRSKPDQDESTRWTADGSLLLINHAYQLYRAGKHLPFIEERLYEPFKEIIDIYRKGTIANTYIDRDGLLVTGSYDINTSWIPLKDKKGMFIRYGKLLEMNALWYNTLKIMEFFSRELKYSKQARKFADMARVVLKSFLKVFWDEEKIRFSDVVRENYRESVLRVNQLYLVGLPFSILDRELGNSVLKQIEDELLTPVGIRSLSAGDPGFSGKSRANTEFTTDIRYNGGIWPWTVGLYFDAVIQVRGEQQHVVNRLFHYLEGFKRIYYNQTISCLPEIFTGEQSYTYAGCIAYLPTMCEILRCAYKLENRRT
jgi:predicted glycogen debranching enzyme